MSTLNVTRSYSDLSLLSASNFDDFLDDIETFFNTTKLTDSNFADGGITASLKLVDSSVTTSLINTSAVTSTVLASDSCTTAKFGTGSIVTAGIADGAVTSSKIAASTLTTAKFGSSSIATSAITDGNVTVGKLAALNKQISASSGSFTTTSLSAVNVTNLSVTITTTGGPVFLGLIPDGDTTNPASVGVLNTTPASTSGSFQFYESTTASVVYSQSLVWSSFGDQYLILKVPPGIIRTIVTGISAGTYTFYARALAVISAGVNEVSVTNCKLIAWEMT